MLKVLLLHAERFCREAGVLHFSYIIQVLRSIEEIFARDDDCRNGVTSPVVGPEEEEKQGCRHNARV